MKFILITLLLTDMQSYYSNFY